MAQLAEVDHLAISIPILASSTTGLIVKRRRCTAFVLAALAVVAAVATIASSTAHTENTEPVVLANLDGAMHEEATPKTSQPSNQPHKDDSKSSHHASSKSDHAHNLTDKPTSKPTSKPTHKSTPKPTSVPTSKPSHTPMHKPTSEPTSKPSHKPSHHPTGAPSNAPTHKPSHHPTGAPSKAPTHKPSHHPTSAPSKAPTHKPSHHPTSAPSKAPTHKPSHHPIKAPTSHPTHSPTAVPTAPTKAPTAAPTHATCTDGMHSPSLGETGVDCGGSTCPACTKEGSACSLPADCAEAMLCVAGDSGSTCMAGYLKQRHVYCGKGTYTTDWEGYSAASCMRACNEDLACGRCEITFLCSSSPTRFGPLSHYRWIPHKPSSTWRRINRAPLNQIHFLDRF
jgi:hypothetical protein